jgi:RNA polymerase-associated protein RTF1
MSDFGDDIDDELLALATEDSDKRRKRRNSYDTPESEEEENNPDPYPLEGKYKNEEDRQWSVILIVTQCENWNPCSLQVNVTA